MSNLKMLYKDLKRIKKIQHDLNVLKYKKLKKINLIEQKLMLRNCETCTNKKCVMSNEDKPIDYCTYYSSNEYKLMKKLKEGIK